MRTWNVAAVLLCAVTWVKSQSLLEAISGYPELSNFTALMTDNPDLAGALLTANTSSFTSQSTVLVPDNSAFSKVSALYNISMGKLSIQQLEPYLEYHLLVGQITSDILSSPAGITVPTFLTGPQFNNRSAGGALGSPGAGGDVHNGQVVFLQAKSDGSSGGSKRFTVRQLQDPRFNAQGGLGHQINLTAVDGRWDGGYFQIVDKFLALPLNCTDSIRRWKMNAFSDALSRTGLGAPLDVTQNVTCFTPNDAAFKQAGSPNTLANITDLEKLVKFHVITEPLYSNFLEDGQMYTTFSNETIRITVRDGDYFVNDAKIINKNVMTNNGLMHVLDRVMSPLNDSSTSQAPTATRSDAPFNTASASASSTSSANNAVAPKLPTSSLLWTVLAVLGGIIA